MAKKNRDKIPDLSSMDAEEFEKDIIYTPKRIIDRAIREGKFKRKRSSNLAVKVHFPPGKIAITFKDGRVLIVPLVLHPTLQKATPKQRRAYQICCGEMIEWEELQYEVLAIQMLNPFGGCCG